jgi:hypothetical protein
VDVRETEDGQEVERLRFLVASLKTNTGWLVLDELEGGSGLVGRLVDTTNDTVKTKTLSLTSHTTHSSWNSNK